MRYLLIIVGVVQLLVGALVIWMFSQQNGFGLYSILPGLSNIFAGLAAMRVGTKGRGHFGLVLINGLIMAPVLWSHWGDIMRFSELPKSLMTGLILSAGLPAAAIVLGLMVQKPARIDD